MEGVLRAGHRFKMDKRTPGDGNCFPRAAKQQCDRHAVAVNSLQCHRDLRTKVTDYMMQSEDSVVVDMRRRWAELEMRWSWESYWRNMARDGVWVEEVFVWATAWFLNRDIWIIWDTATPQNPLSFFSGDREGMGADCPGVPLIIGHHTDTHYQSLLPEGDPVSISLDTRRFAAEIVRTVEKVEKAHKRASRGKRKEAPASESEDEGCRDITILKYGSGKPGVEAKRKQDGGVEYSCLLCQSHQKQIASHMKKMHGPMFQKEELEEFELSLKRFQKAVSNNNVKRKRRERDPEGFKEAKRRESKAKRASGPKKMQEEIKYGHIFPCASCHTLKRRDQVVELDQQQADKIDGKARENHQTLQVEISHTNLKSWI